MVADEISKLASSEDGWMDKDLAMEIQKHPSIEEVPTFIIQNGSSWMTPIVSFLQDGHLPQDPNEARKIKKRVAKFTILNDVLYKEVSPCRISSVSMLTKPSIFWKKFMKEFVETMLALDPL